MIAADTGSTAETNTPTVLETPQRSRIGAYNTRRPFTIVQTRVASRPSSLKVGPMDSARFFPTITGHDIGLHVTFVLCLVLLAGCGSGGNSGSPPSAPTPPGAAVAVVPQRYKLRPAITRVPAILSRPS